MYLSSSRIKYELEMLSIFNLFYEFVKVKELDCLINFFILFIEFIYWYFVSFLGWEIIRSLDIFAKFFL